MKRRTFCQSALTTIAALSPAARLLAAAAGAADDITSDIRAIRLDGRDTTLPRSAVQELRAALRGRLLLPSNAGYDDARKLWNAMIDRRPALITRCAGAADVRAAVNFARAHDLLLAVRGGGHSTSGLSVCDGGLMIDLSPMRSVRVDPAARRARLEPGVLLGEFDREAQAFGLATTAGTVSHTGAAGLTLGGGFGRLGRRFGLACDNLTAVDLITADGELRHATENENPDLFWAVRGGGGNFGVVTSFEYRLHPVGPMIVGGWIQYPMAQARDVLRRFAEYAAEAPDELNADPALFVNREGQGLVSIEACYSGPPARAESALAPLRRLGKVLSDNVGPIPYVKLQASGDEGAAAGKSHYVKSGFLKEISAAAVEAVVEPFLERPAPPFAAALQQMGGAINRVPADATAFPHRATRHDLVLLSSWTDPALAEQRIAAARRYWDRVRPFTSGFYSNSYMTEDEARVRETYGTNYERLLTLKNRYDPQNLFRLNANIRPTAQTIGDTA